MAHPNVNGQLSVESVNAIVHHYGEKVGVPQLAPHDLRRTFARLSREGGAPLEAIQASLGHANITTTTKYIASTESGNAGNFIDVEGEDKGK